MGGYDTPMLEGILVRELAVKWGYTVLNVEKIWKSKRGRNKERVWENILTGKSIVIFYKT